MFALGLNGSPHKKSWTCEMLQNVMAPLEASGWKTNIIQVGGVGLQPCNGCARCHARRDGLCAITTDMFNKIFQEMLKSDAIVLGCPSYIFAGINKEMELFTNRCGYLSYVNNAPLGGKVGTAIVSIRRGNYSEALDRAQRFFLHSKMIVPGISAWNISNSNPHSPKKLYSDQILENMHKLGIMINWLTRATHPHLDELPKENELARPS